MICWMGFRGPALKRNYELFEVNMSGEVFENGYAFLIGVGGDLPQTVEDVTALQRLLIYPTRAAYPPDQVVVITKAEATRSNILNKLDAFINQVNKNPDATVIIHYSGHGLRVAQGLNKQTTDKYYLIPSDYNPVLPKSSSITGLEFTNKIETIKAKKLIVLFDCCHAGGIPKARDLEGAEINLIKSPVPEELLKSLGSGSGRVIIASSREDELSYNGSTYGIFTGCLLEALQGKASVNKDGYARILDILIYLFDQVPQKAPYSQHPFVNKVLDLGDNFPICYYAAGSRFVLGEISTEVSKETPILSKPSLTAGEKRRLRQRKDAIEPEWEIRSEKLKRLRASFAIETDTAVNFKLEKQVLEEEGKIAQLSDELDSIEAKLEEGDG
jgi:Caspase domain